jgi:hypothetical protein
MDLGNASDSIKRTDAHLTVSGLPQAEGLTGVKTAVQLGISRAVWQAER